MSLIDNSRWTKASGMWAIEERKITQSDTTGGIATRLHQEINSSDFIATFKMIVSPINEKVMGEAKFIFSEANSGENYRIDFLHRVNLCRLTIGTVMYEPFQVYQRCEFIDNKEYWVKIALKKNLLSVDIDGMKIFSDYSIGVASDKNIGLGSWDAKVEFRELEVRAYKQRRCFIIMAFNDKRNLLYEYAIKPTLDSHPKLIFNYERADEIMSTGKITQEIIDSIERSEIIIADITEKNANVFYELGIAHSGGRKTLLLIERVPGEKLDIPFDLKDIRCHEYSFSKNGFEEISKTMTAVITSMIDEQPE